jgi:hypothetical protein
LLEIVFADYRRRRDSRGAAPRDRGTSYWADE